MLRRLPILVLTVACVLGYGPRPTMAQDAPMTFEALRVDDARLCPDGCSSVIAASGQITQSTPSDFLDVLRRTGGRYPVVFIDSPGGKVLASMEFGTLLRKVGATMVVAGLDSDRGSLGMTSGRCFSACVYALMGGRRRVIPVESLIGIHRMFAYQQGMSADGEIQNQKRYDNGDMRAFLMRYSSSMGVNPSLIVAAEHVASDELRILTPSDIRRWRLGVPRL